MPGITLSKGITPLQRIERRLELAILQPSSHQFCFLIKHLLIIHRTLEKRLQLLSGLSQSLTQLIDAPVIVSIFQGTGYTLINLHIVWHITQLIVILISQTSGRVYLRMNSLGTMNHSLPKRLYIIAAQTGKISIGYHRGRIITYHTTTMPRTRPLWQETTLLISIGKTFLNLHVFRWIHQVEKREETAESIPKTCIREHIALLNRTIVRTVMHDFASSILLVECTREEYRTIETAIESTEMIDTLILYLYLTQNFVPALTTLLFELIHIRLSQFLEILHSLGAADKRRSYTCLNLFATLTGFESDDGTHMVSLLFVS